MHSRVLAVSSVAVAFFATSLAATSGALAKPALLIVSAEASGEVVFIDPATAQVIERVKVGPRPRGLKLTRDGRQLVVALAGPVKGAPAQPAAGSAGLAVVDVAGRKVAKQIATPPSPFAVDVAPDGKTAYVSNSTTNELWAVDLAAGAVTKKKGVSPEPEGVAVRPDGKAVYVATHAADEVFAIDPKTMNLLGRIDAGARPQSVVLTPRGEAAFVMDDGQPTITVIDTKKNTSKEMMQGLVKPPSSLGFQSAAFSPDGKRLYVTTGPGKSVLIVDVTKKAVAGTVDGVGAFPRGIAVSRDGKKLYVANGASNDVAIIDVAAKKVEARVAVPGAPWGVVLVP